ncbi:UNVERIFIED_CONTAM: Retrovirus-related Pol polyprotein from transposon TNT 1-94, partial [Sesamum radiatum]
LDDVASILQRIKEVYAIQDRHTRYVAIKEFFRAKMTKGSSVQVHGVKMLSLMEKVEDLKARLENDTYIDVILQSLPPSYDPFIVNFNMNGLEKSINELINMLQKTLRALPLLQWEWARERRGWVLSNSRGQTISTPIAVRKGIRRGIVSIYLSIKVLQRSRKLSKDEVVLRFGDGKAVAAEAARGGLSYFITFTDDHSRYGYVYLMRYKFEAFVRFKEFRLEVENQTGRKIKTLRSDRGGEYLSGELIDYLKENSIVSQWTPPGMPQLNGVAEKRNRTVLDMIRLLNIAPSKTVAQTPYQIWHGKPVSYKYLRVWGSPAYVKRLVGDKLDSRSSLCRFIGNLKETAGYYFYDISEQNVFVSRNAVFLERGFPTDTRRDELLLEESSEAPQSNVGTSSPPIVSTDNVSILRRSARVPQPPKRYGFLGVTIQLDNDPKTYGEAMSDINSAKWLEAMKFEMDSMSSNQVTTFKASLVAKGYTQRPRVDFEETFLPVAMVESIQIMVAIAAWYDYEIWQMDVKTAFLNRFVEEEIYMDQPEGFTVVGEEQKLNGCVVAWNSSKQDTTTDSTTEAEYIAASEAAKEEVWMKNYIQELGVVPSIAETVVIFCDNNGAIAQAKEPRSHHWSKHILRRYHLLREIVGRGDIWMDRVNSAENTADLLTKPMSQISHAQHLGRWA